MTDEEISRLHHELIDRLKEEGAIRSPRVEAAFRAIPRHLFLPDVPIEKVYQDQAIVTKWDGRMPLSSSSQPSLMAMMIEQLDLRPGQTVLEIGTATGYNAALLAHIVGDAGAVHTIDIDEDLVEAARRHLELAGVPGVHVILGDGGFGHEEAAPYDRIILTVGSWDIAPAWYRQLREGGRLVLPLALVGMHQKSIAFELAGDHLESISHTSCGFIRLRGAFSEPEGGKIALGPEPNVELQLPYGDDRAIDPDAVYGMLTGPSKVYPIGIRVSEREMHMRLLQRLWLRLRGIVALVATGPLADKGVIPYLSGVSEKFCFSTGLLNDRGMALIVRSPGSSLPAETADEGNTIDLFIRCFGAGEELADQLIAEITAWDASGRSAEDAGLRIRAYPMENPYPPDANELVIEKQHVRLLLDWR
ncbi:MAG: Methyltransferase, FxLD system [Chlorobi bacterium]|nr:Methyltransferase, FxLD system [Chlorobiota bacterium]